MEVVAAIAQGLEIPYSIRNHEHVLRVDTNLPQRGTSERSLRKRARQICRNPNPYTGPLNQFIGIHGKRRPTAVRLNTPSHVMESGREDNRGNTASCQGSGHFIYVTVDLNPIEESVNVVETGAPPETRVLTAELFVVDLAGQPLIEVVRRFLPDSQSLMNVTPGVRSGGECPIQIENRGGNHLEPECTRLRNSLRVFWFSLNAPSIELVTAIECCFSTPRMIMHKCWASMTTATPFGLTLYWMVSATSFVSRSCTCKRRANMSTSRGILLSPMTF